MSEAGSYEAGRRVRLPRGAERPIEVYVNGVRQREGERYRITGNEVVFDPPIVKERVGGARWLAMFLGLFGSYGKNEVIDVHYRLGTATKVVSDAKVEE